ncbi:MAG: helix-turn-helix domain-containing protein [Solirubrobacterales bacterium]
MNAPRRDRELSYEAKARIADNLFLQRKRAGYSQIALGERAMVAPERISAIETGKPSAMLDTYVRLAGALSVTLDDLLAGVTWTPAVLQLEYDPGYEVEFEVNSSGSP